MQQELIIFDMDGTLYQFEGGSFGGSKLQMKVLENAREYIVSNLNKSSEQAQDILDELKLKYKEGISIALEKEYGLDRYDYFNTVWDIPAHEYIEYNDKLKRTLEQLSENYQMVIVTDAPRIWAEQVLQELGVYDLIKDHIFTGEGDERKDHGNSFERVLKKFDIGSSDCISVGDQEHTDIIPAKELGMKTVFINQSKSQKADFNINKIEELMEVL